MAEYLQTNICYLGVPCKSGTLHCNFKTGKRIQRLFFFFKTCAVFALFVYFLPSPFFFVWLNHYFPLIVSERKKREEACACTYGRCMLVTQWEVSFWESVFHGTQFSFSSSVNLKFHQKPTTKSWSQLTPAEAHKDCCSPLKALLPTPNTSAPQGLQ